MSLKLVKISQKNSSIEQKKVQMSLNSFNEPNNSSNEHEIQFK